MAASPFPGMDPYLEGHLWPDVHHQLVSEIGRALTPKLRPRYVARIEVTVFEDASPEAEAGIMYPDVEVLRRGLAPVTLRLASVQVRDARGDQLVTAIEIVSPVNKRQPGLDAYREKRERLRRADVHLVELDLIRRGERPLVHPGLPASDYLVTLTRAGAPRVEVWPLALQDRLPTVPVPLRAPDPDAWFDLGELLARVYEEAAYDLSIDYGRAPPPPPLTPEQDAWRRGLVRS